MGPGLKSELSPSQEFVICRFLVATGTASVPLPPFQMARRPLGFCDPLATFRRDSKTTESLREGLSAGDQVDWVGDTFVEWPSHTEAHGKWPEMIIEGLVAWNLQVVSHTTAGPPHLTLIEFFSVCFRFLCLFLLARAQTVKAN